MGRARLKRAVLGPRWRTVSFLTMLATVAAVSDLASAVRVDPDCHTLRPLHDRHQKPEELPLSLEDKLALSPIVVQGRLISRSASYSGLYFSSMRILKVMKGKVPKRLRRHVRLVFRQEEDDRDRDRSRRRPPCEHPVRFGVRSGRKYLMFLKRLGPARYAAVERPAPWSKHARRVAKKILCEGCASPPGVPHLSPSRVGLGGSGGSSLVVVDQGGSLKLKCRVAKEGNPAASIRWEKNGREFAPGLRIRLRMKKRRSTLRISNVRRSDSGNYTCVAGNVLGERRKSVSINVRYSAPDPSVTNCPIDSFCLNGGTCLFYEFIGELVCRCQDGFVGQRCQFKKAVISLPFVESDACGPYGHDIHFREICAAWKRPPVTGMTRAQYEEWIEVENQLEQLRRRREREDIHRFRSSSAAKAKASRPPTTARPVLQALPFTDPRGQ